MELPELSRAGDNIDPRLSDTIFDPRVLMYLDPAQMGLPPEQQLCMPCDDRARATLVTSLIAGAEVSPLLHMPCFDIDIPFENVRLVESASGNTHLFINKTMTWENYCKLMRVMQEVGLLEKGWVEKSIAQGCGRLRLPGVPKLQPTRGGFGY